MRHRLIRCVWVSVLAVGLSACAIQPPAPVFDTEPQSIAEWNLPEAPERWRLTGRLSLRLVDAGASASVDWEQMHEAYTIDLRGALGAGSLRIQGGANGVTLQSADGERYQADSPSELVRAFTGYSLPVRFLRWWVLGQPVPWLNGHVALDAQGRAQVLWQDGWQVRMDRYQLLTPRYALPERISIERGDVRVRLLVRDWQIDP